MPIIQMWRQAYRLGYKMLLFNNSYGREEPSKKDAEKFIDEILEICKKHNISISHEDCHGAFMLLKFDQLDIEWLRQSLEFLR